MAIASVKRKKDKFFANTNNKDEVIFTMQEFSLMERIVRVEEEIKSINSNIKILIHQMDKRFEMMQKSIDERFESIDKRFESIDKRFESIDKRFEELREDMNRRFNTLTWIITGWMTMLSGLIVLFKFVR